MVSMEILSSVGLFVVAFTLLWIGSGVAVEAITKISRSLHMSSFFVSFFLMGLFTSITEIMVGINAVIDAKPEIFVGNLIGSSVVMFLLVVPLLAVLGNGVKLNHNFKYNDLVTAALVVGMPALLTMDNRITLVDLIVCLVVYAYFVFTQSKNNGTWSRLVIGFGGPSLYKSLTKIFVAVIIVFLASDILVSQTADLATYFNASPFLISLLVISIGTNIPEISIAIRAVLAKKKDIAFGNYLGSASLNTFELGLLGLITPRPIAAMGSNYSIIIFLLGLILFLVFAKSQNNVSRKEGFLLLMCYLLFIMFEMITGPGWQL